MHKTILILLLVGAMSSWVFMLSLDRHYYFTAPREPDAKAGRIYAEHVKTTEGVAQVYLTRSEKLRYPYCMFATFVLFFTGYFLNKHWKIFRNRPEKMQRTSL